MEYKIPSINKGNGLLQMLDLQKALIKKYIKIEGLPEYPIDIHSKPGQRLLKDFTRRFIEELAEAYDSAEQAFENISANKTKEAKEFVKAFNEEIADAMHFLLETLVYLGIDQAEMDNTLHSKLQDKSLMGLYKKEDPLGTLFALANYMNTQENSYVNPASLFTIIPLHDRLENTQTYGCSKIGVESLLNQSVFLWQITYHISKAMNQLKNRDWSVEEKKVNEVHFQEVLVESIIIIFRYLDLVGITQLSLFASYYIKNQINHERIKSGY